MLRSITLAALLFSTPALARQITNNPFPAPIESTAGVIAVKFAEFATVPEINGEPPRMMHLIDEPATKRLFVSTMQGSIFGISYDGKTVTRYLDVHGEDWKVRVQAGGAERGFQSFAFHPQFPKAVLSR